MCRVFTFHHICGHVHSKKTLSCPHSAPYACSASQSRAESDGKTSSVSPCCVDAVHEPHLYPTLCDTCKCIGIVSDWFAAEPGARFQAIMDWRKAREDRGDARSQSLSVTQTEGSPSSPTAKLGRFLNGPADFDDSLLQPSETSSDEGEPDERTRDSHSAASISTATTAIRAGAPKVVSISPRSSSCCTIVSSPSRPILSSPSSSSSSSSRRSPYTTTAPQESNDDESEDKSDIVSPSHEDGFKTAPPSHALPDNTITSQLAASANLQNTRALVERMAVLNQEMRSRLSALSGRKAVSRRSLSSSPRPHPIRTMAHQHNTTNVDSVSAPVSDAAAYASGSAIAKLTVHMQTLRVLEGRGGRRKAVVIMPFPDETVGV